MIPVWLEHQGSHAFPTKTLFLSFADLPQIVTVTGPNGAGKTTIFNLIHAARYLSMPDRPGPLHKKFLANGFIDLGWMKEPGGTLYRSRVDVDVDAGRTEANLYAVPDNDPANRAARKPHLAGPLSKTYLEWIALNLPSEEMVLASDYAIQKQREDGSFLSLKLPERRELMAEMLGLKRYPRYEAHFKSQRQATEGRVNVIRTRMDALRTRVDKAEKARVQREEVETRIGPARFNVDVVEQEVGTLKDGRSRATGEYEALSGVSTEYDTLLAELESATNLEDMRERLTNNRKLVERAERIRDAHARDQVLRTEQAQLSAIQADADEVAKEIVRLTKQITSDDKRLASTRAVLKRRDEVSAATARAGEIKRQLTDLSALIEELGSAYDLARTTYQQQLSDRSEASGLHVAEVSTHNALVEAVATIDTVPCGAVGEYAACPFLLRAVEARDRLPGVIERKNALEKRALFTLSEPRDGSRPLRVDRTALEQEAGDLEPVLALASDIASADLVISEIEARVQDHHTSVNRLRTRLDTELTPKLTRAPQVQTERDSLSAWVKFASKLEDAPQRIKELEESIATAEREKASKETRRDDLAVKVGRRKTLNGEIADLQRRIAEKESGLTARRRELTDMDELAAGLGPVILDGQEAGVDLVREEAALAKESTALTDYTLLNRAFGPTGIPTFRIDAALPEINLLGNDLLRECYGREVFTLKLSTQRQDSTGKRMLEDLDLIVLKAGVPMDADDLSGGQEVLVKEAIAIGFALYNAARTGRRVYTLFRDEVSANLSPAAAPLYTQMLRRACQVGGFQRVLFITHHRGCVEKADAELVVNGDETLTLRSH